MTAANVVRESGADSVESLIEELGALSLAREKYYLRDPPEE
ncbi:MAG TPA: hypothetical protein VF503_13660 [Sphingobium sp.]